LLKGFGRFVVVWHLWFGQFVWWVHKKIKDGNADKNSSQHPGVAMEFMPMPKESFYQWLC
jgi:hypothetical protein